MTSAYEWIITTRSFYRTRIELLSAAFPRLHSLPNKISELFSRTKFDDWKKKDQLWGYNNIPAKAEILIICTKSFETGGLAISEKNSDVKTLFPLSLFSSKFKYSFCSPDLDFYWLWRRWALFDFGSVDDEVVSGLPAEEPAVRAGPAVVAQIPRQTLRLLLDHSIAQRYLSSTRVLQQGGGGFPTINYQSNKSQQSIGHCEFIGLLPFCQIFWIVYTVNDL